MKTHLRHRSGVACNHPTARRRTLDPRAVTCIACCRSPRMADAEQRLINH